MIEAIQGSSKQGDCAGQIRSNEVRLATPLATERHEASRIPGADGTFRNKSLAGKSRALCKHYWQIVKSFANEWDFPYTVK